MTTHRRPLLLSAAAAMLLPVCVLLPACVSVTSTPLAPPEVRDKFAAGAAARPTEKSADRKSEFRVFTARPGTVVHTKAANKDATAQMPAADPAPPSSDAVRPAGEPNTLTLPTITPPPGPPPEPPLVAAMREFAAGRPERAIQHLQSLGPANQDVVLAIFPVVTAGATADLAGDPNGTAVLIDQLRATIDRLEGRAALRIDAVALCENVDRFGKYDPRPSGKTYRPNDIAQLYLEVRNLVSQPAPGLRGETHVTRAHVRVEVLDAHGAAVDQPDPKDPRRPTKVVGYVRELFTRGPVHDFHVLHTFPVPAAPGVYTVTVEVRDPGGRRSVKTAPVRFDVAGP